MTEGKVVAMGTRAGWGVVDGPGITALGLAAARAVEGGRPDALVRDPYATDLARGTDSPVAFPLSWPGPGAEVGDRDALFLHGSRYIGLRTRFFDDGLLRAAADGVRQVVLLGAGLDTRAYRLPWPAGVGVHELDQPGVLAYKDRVLAGLTPRCRRVAVGADLRTDWPSALLGAGFAAAVPTAWVAEGLLAYLPGQEQLRLLEHVGALSAPGSTLALDRLAATAEGGSGDAAVRRLAERSGIAMDVHLHLDDAAPGAFLVGRGWSVGEEDVSDVAARYGRDLSDPFHADTAAGPPWMHTLFLTARRA
jgi:methyltransferase (TIGR00027 family)